ncbi:MAG TPA: ABC transporter ATP-binding protein [Rhodospirillaceae bacterium]|nr:ABC transporter ATP-binding protein [Rhodospirillaceae bacterium]
MLAAGNAERLAVEITGKRWKNGTPVLGDIRFRLSGGEIVALSGPSGCGKSTLLAILAGLDHDFQGRVAWSGAQRVGVVFQTPRLLPWRSAEENVALALGGGREALSLARARLAEMGLAEAAGLYPARLSLGMARRVAMARALIIDPEVLLLDEAFVSLDATAANHLRGLILDAAAQRGTSVLMVSHDPRECLDLAHRQLVLEGNPARLRPSASDPDCPAATGSC